VEDAAAIIAWARAEVSPSVSVVGVSLGGLIATQLAAQLELDRVIAVAPFCDPAATLSQRPPTPSLRHLGMIGDYSGSWGSDRAGAGLFLQSTLAPLVARNLTPPRTPGNRITLVRAMQDLVVGPDPVTELADAWQTDLWTYPHGHMTVMSAHGIARRITERATSRDDEPGLPVAV
jgi:pimeloyl-ACP methyl ester carboxylesterase